MLKEKDRAIVLNQHKIIAMVIKQLDNKQKTQIKVAYIKNKVIKKILNNILEKFIINKLKIIYFNNFIYILL